MATLVNKGEQSAEAVAAANKAEVERLSIHHRVVKDAMGYQLIFPPLDMTKPDLRFLDSATADGLWLRNVQAMSPVPDTHSYIGFDINPGLFPDTLPPNMTLVQHSLADPFPADWHGTFDLMNQRFGLVAARQTPLQPIVGNFVAALKPGGWLQLTEMDIEGPEGAAMIRITGLVKSLLTAVRGEASIIQAIPELMKAAGLTDIEQRDPTILVGARNPKPEMQRESVESMIITLQGLLGAAVHMPPGTLGDDLDGMVEWAEKDLIENGGSWRIKTFWGRKA